MELLIKQVPASAAAVKAGLGTWHTITAQAVGLLFPPPTADDASTATDELAELAKHHPIQRIRPHASGALTSTSGDGQNKPTAPRKLTCACGRKIKGAGPMSRHKQKCPEALAAA